MCVSWNNNVKMKILTKAIQIVMGDTFRKDFAN